MGLFGYGGVGHKIEEKTIEKAMNRIGAVRGDSMRNCERCSSYVGHEQSGSNYYGGCRTHQIKVFSSYVCSNFNR
jgi:hypothetical protein